MSKKKITPIKIREKDEADYKRLVRNAKSKIKRTIENYGVDISSEVRLPELESFKTRKQFNQWKEEMQQLKFRQDLQFVKNEHGVVARKTEVNALKRKQKAIINQAKQLKKRVEKLPVILDKLQLTVGEKMLGLSETEKRKRGYIQIPKDFDFTQVKSREEYQRKKKQIESKDDHYYDKRLNRMKVNYMNKIHETLNSDGDKLIEVLSKMDDMSFYEMYMQNEQDFSFSVWYIPDGMDEQEYFSDLADSLLDLVMRYEESDLKKF